MIMTLFKTVKHFLESEKRLEIIVNYIKEKKRTQILNFRGELQTDF